MTPASPVRFSVDYPDRALDRLTSALRIFTVIPIAIVLASIGGFTAGVSQGSPGATTIVVGGTGLLFLPMDHRYPSTDEAQSVHLELDYPDARVGLNRWMPLVKWFWPSPTTSPCSC
jgi:hypothetical protein